MKKALTVILTLVLVMSLSVPAFAEYIDYNYFDERSSGGATELVFMYTPASPTYTVAIPASMELSVGDNHLPIIVSDAENLGGKKVTVFLFDTSASTNISSELKEVRFALSNIANDHEVPYYLYDAYGSLISGTYRIGYGGDFLSDGLVLAEFVGNGSHDLVMGFNQNIVNMAQPNVLYSGYIIFGIKCE